jgi:hypothetical protein
MLYPIPAAAVEEEEDRPHRACGAAGVEVPVVILMLSYPLLLLVIPMVSEQVEQQVPQAAVVKSAGQALVE